MNIDDTSYMLLLKTCIMFRKIAITLLQEQRQNNSGVLSRSNAIIVLRAHHKNELFPDAILYTPLWNFSSGDRSDLPLSLCEIQPSVTNFRKSERSSGTSALSWQLSSFLAISAHKRTSTYIYQFNRRIERRSQW